MIKQTIQAFVHGIHNILPDEDIPIDAASDSLNWLTRNGRIELSGGRRTVGAAGAAGKNYGEWTGFRADGTAVRFRKVDSAIQTLNAAGTTWTDVITGLSLTDYVASNYQSLAGAFIYFFGIDGIYKIATANPTSFTSLYDATKNFKGYAFIDRARSILWGRAQDPTGLYGSYIDSQTAVSGATGVYTTVSGEATASLSGTLAFKAGGATRTGFGVVITLTGSGEVFTDNYNGVLVGSLGHTGTIDYTTGAYTLSIAGVGTAAYQWENSNLRGVTDFSKSATRLAGEGFVVRQDAGGDAIQTVIPLAGSYFSMKKHSSYRFALDSTDLNPVNEIFRTDIGVSSLRSAVGTGQGILYMNTGNPSFPRLSILSQNPLGDNFLSTDLFAQYDFAPFDYSDCLVDFYDIFCIIACKDGTAENNTLLMCNVTNKTVDRTYYGIRTSTRSNGFLYGGDPVSKTTYELFTGLDDLGNAIQNFWISKADTYGPDQTRANRYLLGVELKKVKRLRFQGLITPQQQIAVYFSEDEGDFQLVGTIRGDGDYVSYAPSSALGTLVLGDREVGGGVLPTVNEYFMEMKIKTSKFRKRQLKFVALGIGYCSIDALTDYDILTFGSRMPKKYRLKQNVSLSGATTDMPNPQF